MVKRTAGEVYFIKRSYRCKGSRLNHRGTEAGNLEVQSIRGLKMTDGGSSLRRRHCVGGGAPPVPKNRRRRPGAAWEVKFSNLAYLFQKFFSRRTSVIKVGLCMLNNYFLRLSGLKIGKKKC